MNQSGTGAESTNLFSLNPIKEELIIGVIYSILAVGAMPLYVVVLTVSGCTANSLWLAMFPIMSILSIKQILILREAIRANVTPIALKILMVIGWLYTIGVWLWGCITQNFSLSGVGWSYDFTKLGAATLSALEWYFCFPCLGLTYLAYLIIVLHVHTTRKIASSRRTEKHEIRIFLQSTVLCVCIMLLIVLWHNAESWFAMTNITIAVLNSSWICFLYLNPIFLLVLNKTIRAKVLRLINSKSESTTNLSMIKTNKRVMMRTNGNVANHGIIITNHTDQKYMTT
ncbi:hypothetical protein NECAME_07526 [Necator americanus]|uniref:G-protein coupled receptors family 1 profile domain-containing protein n=1 Tax=Necator americanus TaxID=51031 RepID=W2TPV8_NECAM|nr:hypothetical protein NECAME_07526 [Necator americanus]ETN83166.1 hypothetical protein NECAME_07526 [Necator americanus]